MWQPIKLSSSQYKEFKNFVRNEWGNISLPKGLFLVTFIYLKHIPTHVRNHYRMKYYQPFDKKKSRYSHGK